MITRPETRVFSGILRMPGENVPAKTFVFKVDPDRLPVPDPNAPQLVACGEARIRGRDRRIRVYRVGKRFQAAVYVTQTSWYSGEGRSDIAAIGAAIALFEERYR